MSPDIYSSLMQALTMPDMGDISCYPVRMSAAGAIAELVEVGVVCTSEIQFLSNLNMLKNNASYTFGIDRMITCHLSGYPFFKW